MGSSAKPVWCYEATGKTRVFVEARTQRTAIRLIERGGYHVDKKCVYPESVEIVHRNGDSRIVQVEGFYERSMYVRWPYCGLYTVMFKSHRHPVGVLLEAREWRVAHFASLLRDMGYAVKK